MTIKCPKCGHLGDDPSNCLACGIVFEGYRHFLAHQATQELAPSLPPSLQGILADSKAVFVQQKEDALRILTGWQTRNHYTLNSESGQVLAYLAERDTSGWSVISRLFLRSGRPFVFDLVDPTGAPLARLSRPFAWFFPCLAVSDPATGQVFGYVQKRFGVLRNVHYLCDERQTPFARLQSSLLGGRSIGDALLGKQVYSLMSLEGSDTGAFITREWNGAFNRLFTDEDTFYVEFSSELPPARKLLLLCASICIDFEAYERDKGPSRRFGLFDRGISTITGGGGFGGSDGGFGGGGDGY